MLAPFAYLLAWTVFLGTVAVIVVVSLLAGMSPALRGKAAALRAGATGSIAGVALAHAIAFPVAALGTIAVSVFSTFASQGRLWADPPPWATPPLLLLMLGLPVAASFFGLYLGFRAGWERQSGRSADQLLKGDALIGVVGNLGRRNPVRWFLSRWYSQPDTSRAKLSGRGAGNDNRPAGR